MAKPSTPKRMYWLITAENTTLAGKTAAGKFTFLMSWAFSRMDHVAL